ncbi:MAG: phosphatidate cytidylyltransferase [Saprospiraceae bacterium]|nr:phosphatidate cytidylyltransferase [Saprospiraceae bacterium]
MYKRIITGLILGFVMISALLVNEISAVMLLSTIAIFSSFEWRKCFLVPKKRRNIFLIVSIILLFSGLILAFQLEASTLRRIGNVLCIISIIQILLYLFSLIKTFPPDWFAKIGPGILYIILPTIAAIYFLLENFELHRYLLLSFIIINWSNDTMAYFGGKLYGRNPLAPTISPKKTIEGSITGLIFGIVSFYLCNLFFNFELNNVAITIIAIAIVIAGALGDLFESSLKRLVQIKDSGKLLPGHGGFLDRFDSFYFVLPVGILLYYTFIHRS